MKNTRFHGKFKKESKSKIYHDLVFFFIGDNTGFSRYKKSKNNYKYEDTLKPMLKRLYAKSQIKSLHIKRAVSPQ